MSSRSMGVCVVAAFLSLIPGSAMPNEATRIIEALERAAINDNKLHEIDVGVVFGGVAEKGSPGIIHYLESIGFVADLAILPYETVVTCADLVLPVDGFGVILDRPANVVVDWMRVFVVTDSKCNASSIKVGHMPPIYP